VDTSSSGQGKGHHSRAAPWLWARAESGNIDPDPSPPPDMSCVTLIIWDSSQCRRLGEGSGSLPCSMMPHKTGSRCSLPCCARAPAPGTISSGAVRPARWRRSPRSNMDWPDSQWREPQGGSTATKKGRKQSKNKQPGFPNGAFPEGIGDR